MQGANIAFSKAIGFVVAWGHYNILVDPVLGTMSFHSGTLESGPLIGDDDVREPELGVDLFFEGLDRGVGSDIGDRDENGVSGQDVYHYQTVTEAPAPRVPFASLLFLGLGLFEVGPGDPKRPRMIHREHAKGCFRKRSHSRGNRV
jgi:hypothetical protein